MLCLKGGCLKTWVCKLVINLMCSASKKGLLIRRGVGVTPEMCVVTHLLDSLIACLNDNAAVVVDCQQQHTQILLMSTMRFNQPAIEMC